VTITRLFPTPAAALDVTALPDLYPRADKPTLRVNFVSSIDGAATLDGHSGGLGGPTDLTILRTLRMMCDVLVVGAATVHAEGYADLGLNADQHAWREAHGLPPDPPLVTLSRPSPATPATALTFAPGGDVLTAPDLTAAIEALHRRGATQILCEGGPRLLGALIEDDLVDEMCLTLSPLLLAGDAPRIAHGPQSGKRQMSLRHVLADRDELFLRYTRPTREHR